MNQSEASVAEELAAVLRADLTTGIDHFVNSILCAHKQLRHKLQRKEGIIIMLQAALNKHFNENKKLEEKLKKFDLPTANLGIKEMKELREKIKKLKAKNRHKSIQVRKYKLLLDDYAAQQYADDLEQEDGPPSECSDAEDLEMKEAIAENGLDAVAENLLNEADDESTESDPEDSDFVLRKADKDEAEMDRNESEELANKSEMDGDQKEEESVLKAEMDGCENEESALKAEMDGDENEKLVNEVEMDGDQNEELVDEAEQKKRRKEDAIKKGFERSYRRARRKKRVLNVLTQMV